MAPFTVLDFETLEVTATSIADLAVEWIPESKKKAKAAFTSVALSPCVSSGLLLGSASVVFRANACCKYKVKIDGVGCSHDVSPTITVTRRRGFDPMAYETTALLKARSSASGSPSAPTSARCSTAAMEPFPGFDSLEKEISLVCGDRITISGSLFAIQCGAIAANVTFELVEPTP